jgi:cbb3-type cytochrome oxidase cytochrome c subunit
MPATEETYRSQPTLHVIFALSSVVMLLATVWMVMADHLRQWKEVQRDFHTVERKKLEKAESEKLQEQKTKYQAQIDELDAKVKAAEAGAAERASQIRTLERDLRKLGGTADRLDTQRRFQKATLDSKRSFYDGMIDRDEEREARSYLETVVAPAESELDRLSRELEAAQKERQTKQDAKEALLGFVDNLKKEHGRLTRELDRVKRQIEQKDAQYFGPLAWFRSLPLMDFAAPPTKIQQVSLPELTINYNFKEVPRYDRCATCHQGIDRIGYDTDAEGREMKRVFRSHPFLTKGATAIDPHGKVVAAGLYLDANGPHPLNSFGCTICHGGQGSGTDFTYASHTPNDLDEAKRWEKEHDWREIHMWDFPMYPKRFIEATCLKCHHQVTDVPQAQKLQAGYQRIVKFGCTGCHQIGGDGSPGPDLSDERPIGPNLSHVASKVSTDWIKKWIANPHAFRPDSRMPRYYGLSNNNDPDDWPKIYAEIHGVVQYLFSKSTPPEGFIEPPAKTDPKNGQALFLQKGCMACHQHRPYKDADLVLSDSNFQSDAYKGQFTNPAYNAKADAPYDPGKFPASVQQYARASFGPNLTNIAAKFPSQAQGVKWLTNWILAPENYHPKSLMPNLQLSLQDAADIASWLISMPGEFPVKVEVPPAESREVKSAIDELVKLYVSKSGGFRKADGKTIAKSLSEVDNFVANELTTQEKLHFLGEKTISRLGCFGCHTIPGFEGAKPIGTALGDWGIKSPARLDYGHIREYLADKPPDDDGNRDGTDLYYQEKINHETRSGFLFQKLHRPRSFDYLKKSEKYKTWDDRLRMPQFSFANDPGAIEEVMTFVLGLTSEKISARYLPKIRYSLTQTAAAKGAKVINRFNCDGCHVLEMPKFTIPAGVKVAEAFTDFRTNVRSSYTARNSDYLKELYPDLAYDPNKKLDPGNIESQLGLGPDDGAEITIEGMPIGLFEKELTVQLWRPVTIRGYAFSIGDNVSLIEDPTKVQKTPAVGGDLAWLFATYQSERTGTPFDSFWNRLPPPLLREGKKVQTPWLTAFLTNPHPIRPAVQLRMPRFHFGKSDVPPSTEPEELANYFAARDRADFPYQSIPEQTTAYLEERNKEHPNYLAAGWEMMTNKASPCIQCHAIGQFKPTGGAQVVNGPDLREVAARFRPEFLETWTANPRRLVPYTAMPQNIAPHAAVQIPVPRTFENKPIDMVRAVRDTLLNYVNAVELQLASSSSVASAATPPPKPSGSSP